MLPTKVLPTPSVAVPPSTQKTLQGLAPAPVKTILVPDPVTSEVAVEGAWKIQTAFAPWPLASSVRVPEVSENVVAAASA